jgi:hypothetical protein
MKAILSWALPAMIPLALLFLLFGSTASDYLAAGVGMVRDAATTSLPHEVRLKAVRHQIEAAESEAGRIGRTIGELDGMIADIEGVLKTLAEEDRADKEVLARIGHELKAIPADGRVTIGGKDFKKLDLERDGRALLARLERRTKELQHRQDLVEGLRQQRASQQGPLSEWGSRLDELKLSVLEANGYINQLKFAQRIRGTGDAGGGALVRAEIQGQNLLRDLRVEVSATRATNDVVATTRVEQAIHDAASLGSGSVADRIAAVLK